MTGSMRDEPAVMPTAVHITHAYLQSRPPVPDDPERLFARLEQLRAQRAAENECPGRVHGPSTHRATTGCIRCTCNHGKVADG